MKMIKTFFIIENLEVLLKKVDIHKLSLHSIIFTYLIGYRGVEI